MTRLAQLFFALLVIATGAAFFLAQKLKTADPVLLSFRISAKAISPNGDGRFERQRITFRLKRNELIDVAVVDDRGDRVRELVSGLRLPAYRTISPLVWNGRDQQGVIVADGRYRIRVTLRREGRSIVVPQSFLVDTTPPKVRVISIGPGTGPGPEMLPRADGRPAEVTLNSAACWYVARPHCLSSRLPKFQSNSSRTKPDGTAAEQTAGRSHPALIL